MKVLVYKKNDEYILTYEGSPTEIPGEFILVEEVEVGDISDIRDVLEKKLFQVH